MECVPDLSFLTMAAAANSEIYKMAAAAGGGGGGGGDAVYHMAAGGGELYAKMMRPSVMIKQRKTNFTPREVEVLLAAVDKRRDIVLFGTAGGQVWARAWQEVAQEVTAVEGIHRTEGDVRKKWTYLKWEAKNTSKPGRDPTSRAVLEILTGGDPEAAATIGARSLLEELLVPAQNSGSQQSLPQAQQPQQQGQPNQSQQQQQQPQAQQQQQQPQAQQQQTQAQQQTPQAQQQTPQAQQQQQPMAVGAATASVVSGQSSLSTPSSPSPSVIIQPRKTAAIAPASPPEVPTEVCLRWNSYHSNMQAVFPSLLNNEQFVDVTLACEGQSIKCHKIMLSACSNYFEELLSQNPCQHPIVLMKDLRFWEVQALVDFMYRGEVNVSQDRLPSLLAAAEALQIKGLAGPATTNYHDESTGPDTVGSSSGRRHHRKRKSVRQSPRPAHIQNNVNPVPNNTPLRHSNLSSSLTHINSIRAENSPSVSPQGSLAKHRRVTSPQINSSVNQFEDKDIKKEPLESPDESSSKFEQVDQMERVPSGSNREDFVASIRELERVRKRQELNQTSSNESDDYDYDNENDNEEYETECDENRSISPPGQGGGHDVIVRNGKAYAASRKDY